MAICSLTPHIEFQDLTKTTAAILPVPMGGAHNYELWIGQNDRTIVILNPSTLVAKEYLTCTCSEDSSLLHQYLSDSFVSHLILEELSFPRKPLSCDGQNFLHFLFLAR